MKRKLTLTVNSRTTHRAKVLAKERGISLSQLIEGLLDAETGRSRKKSDTGSFSERWAGKLELSEQEDARMLHLRKKHGLERDT